MDYSQVKLKPPPSLRLPIRGPEFQRPASALLKKLQAVSTATASAELHRMGIRQTFIEGPRSFRPGTKIVGSAVTLQFMPQREDVGSGAAQENAEKFGALWHVFTTVQPGDVLMVQAWGHMHTGVVGEMLTTYFKGRGGIGMVIDGCFRDWPNIKPIGTPMWARASTPNYASQDKLFPWAYNVPVALSNVLVLPGDIVIADDDGIVVVPQQMADQVAEITLAHEDWENFSRMKLAEGGELFKYYPLNEEGQKEYAAWKKRGKSKKGKVQRRK
jgi:regulator of RNase E activity RraA